jgi:hypothetical protein
VKFDLPPAGSLLLFLGHKPVRSQVNHLQTSLVLPIGKTVVSRMEPNVLTLDFVDVRAGSETRTNLYYYQAGQLVWRQNGVPRNPWDSAVQFQDELIRKTFPADSGFTVSYRFQIQGQPPSDLEAVVERPDLYSITCNGKPLKPSGQWWLDKVFGRLKLAGTAQPGENTLTLTARPFTIFHEIEPAYILGSFSLEPGPSGFSITREEPLSLEQTRRVLTHSGNPEGTMWLSSGIRFQEGGNHPDDRAPHLVFDLGKPQSVSSISVWNYSETYVRDLTSRGVKRLKVSAAADLEALLSGGPAARSLGEFELPKATSPAQGHTVLQLPQTTARYLRFDILENHYGTTFPATGDPGENGFAGLAKVEFRANNKRIEGVTIAKASSELTSHRRQAGNILGDKGLTWSQGGWNSQGMPFYAGKVCYREEFKLDDLAGTYSVSLGEWLGSVAQVRVNGKPAGWIVSAPWECDVTRLLRKGQNVVEVTVIGTLKNTLGPHHGNPALGAAWPNQFQRGPETGPPAGLQYSTVGYGLFEKFALKQRKPGPVQLSQ